MRLKMLCKVMLTKIVANHGCYVLGGVSCFTSSTADLGNDFITPFTERHSVLINQNE